MKKTTTAAVAHWPTASAATTPTVISVCEITWRRAAACTTLAKIGQPVTSTSRAPSPEGHQGGDVLKEAQPLAGHHDEKHGAEEQAKEGQHAPREVGGDPPVGGAAWAGTW